MRRCFVLALVLVVGCSKPPEKAEAPGAKPTGTKPTSKSTKPAAPASKPSVASKIAAAIDNSPKPPPHPSGPIFHAKSVRQSDRFSVKEGRGMDAFAKLYGVHGPNHGQTFGEESRLALAEKIFDKPLTMIARGRMKEGYRSDTVYVAGRNINLEMVAEGLAWHDINEAPDDQELAAAEQQARSKKLGLWADPNPIAPWKWRGNDNPPAP